MAAVVFSDHAREAMAALILDEDGIKRTIFLSTLEERDHPDRIKSCEVLFDWDTKKVLLMRSTQSLSVTLPHEMVDMIKAKVAAGEYASESEVIYDGLRTLEARDTALAQWLQDDVAKSFDAYKADMSIGIPASQVSAVLDKRLKSKSAK